MIKHHLIKGAVIMKQKKIKLESVDDARAFVKAATKCDFDVNVFYNRVVIDAKSILGTNELFEAFLTEKEANVAAA